MAEFRLGRISAWPKPKPKFGATLDASEGNDVWFFQRAGFCAENQRWENQMSASKRHCFTGHWLMTSLDIYL